MSDSLEKSSRSVPVIAVVLSLVAIIFVLALSFRNKSQEVRNAQMLSQDTEAEVVTSEPIYFKDFRGFLAKPADEGVYPGVVMIHEFWGLNENIRQMARELSKEGYVVLAVDLFGEVAVDTERAAHLSSSVDQAAATENMRAAAQYLRDREKVSKTASLGWCFGGGQSLQLALSGEKMDATVIYYGRVTDDKARLEKINWPVLGIFAGEDRGISVSSVNAFDRTLDELSVVNEIYIYPGVGHAFANPSGMNFSADETRDAWEKTTAFLEKYLKAEK